MLEASKDYVAGVAAGVATVAVGHPFDTVKVNLQAHNSSGASHLSALKCAGWILKQDGVGMLFMLVCSAVYFCFKVRGLYKGATSSFIGMAVESSLLFGIYAQTKTALKGGENEFGGPKMSAVIPSAALGGALISTILCPTELVKCRLQVQGKDSRYNGPLDCARKTLHASGIQGLFRGWTATFLRESAGNVCFFATYETSRHLMLSYFSKQARAQDDSSRLSRTMLEAAVGIVSGGISGMAFWLAVLPFDVAKTRIQTAADLSETRSVMSHLKMILKEVGFRGLYTGLGPTLLRAFPANAAAIVTWELAAKLLGRKQLQTMESSFV